MTAQRITILGAGISGLVLGRCLLQRGVRAVLFEKSKPSPRRNQYGITLHASAYRPLLNFLGTAEKAFLSNVSICTPGTGDELHTHKGKDESIRVNRHRFESFLAQGLDIRYEHEFGSMSQSSDLVLEFNNGVKHESKLVIGADGVHSRLRQQISPATDFKILPYAVFNGKQYVPYDNFDDGLKEHFHGENVASAMFDGAVYQIAIGEYNKEEVLMNFTYSRPAKPGPDPDPLYQPTRSKSEATAFAEAFLSELDTGQLYEEPFKTVFNRETLQKTRILHWLMRTLQVDRAVLDSAADCGIVLIGEAAHAEPILGGFGANEAIHDGMILAEILVKDHPHLNNFYNQRYGTWTKGIVESEQRIEVMHSGPKSNL